MLLLAPAAGLRPRCCTPGCGNNNRKRSSSSDGEQRPMAPSAAEAGVVMVRTAGGFVPTARYAEGGSHPVWENLMSSSSGSRTPTQHEKNWSRRHKAHKNTGERARPSLDPLSFSMSGRAGRAARSPSTSGDEDYEPPPRAAPAGRGASGAYRTSTHA